MNITLASKTQKRGFTIVELIVVIVVIGILAAVGIVGYGQWQKKIANDQVKSDLTAAASAMESARNFSETGYPSSLPSTFKPSEGVTLTGGSNDGGKTYCINGTTSRDTSAKYRIAENGKIVSALCPTITVSSAPRYSMTLGETGSLEEYGNVGWLAPSSNGGSPVISYRIRFVPTPDLCMEGTTTDIVPVANLAKNSWTEFVYGYESGHYGLYCSSPTGSASAGLVGQVYIAAINSKGMSPELQLDYYGFVEATN